MLVTLSQCYEIIKISLLLSSQLIQYLLVTLLEIFPIIYEIPTSKTFRIIRHLACLVPFKKKFAILFMHKKVITCLER